MVYETIALPLSYAGGTIGIISFGKTRSTGGQMDGLSIAASLVELVPRLSGGTIRTIYQPDRTRFVFRVYAGEDVRLLIDLRAAAVRATSATFENPASPSTFVMLLRKHLRDGRVVSLRQSGWDRVVTLEVTRREGSDVLTYHVVAELVGTRGNLHLLKDGAIVRSLRADRRNDVGRPYVGLPSQGKLDPEDVTPELLEMWLASASPEDALLTHVEGLGRATSVDLVEGIGQDDPALELGMRLKELVTFVTNPSAFVSEDGSKATFYPPHGEATAAPSFQDALDRVEAQTESEDARPRDPVLRDLQRAVRTKKRTIEKLHEWLQGSPQADVWQSQADLLMTYLSQIPHGQSSVQLRDPAYDRDVVVPLDPSLSAIENAQALYKRAKRIRRGHPHVLARLEQTTQELETLERALAKRERGEPVEETTLKLLTRRTKKTPPAKKPLPFRQFDVDGFQVWLGKSARQNDALLRAASPSDLWLHVQGHAGSHVVVRSQGRTQVPPHVVRAAARLAVQYSKARTEKRAQVIVTRVKNVRKPKGAPSGLVNVRDADTLTVDLVEGEA
jgi:predicted ribosome quality control (RQC) complex YloA/Tae2 family protein